MKRSSALATVCLAGLMGLPVLAQTRQERREKLNNVIAQATRDSNTTTRSRATTTAEPTRASPGQLMREPMSVVDLREVPAKDALGMWSKQSDVPLIINWKSLENQGIDSQTPITLRLNDVSSGRVLALIIKQMHPNPFGDDRLIVQSTRWYVSVITKRDALNESVTKIYMINDMLMELPNFDDAPGFDLNAALSNTSTGGSNGGGQGGNNGNSGNPFGDTDDSRERVRTPSKGERAETIADIIRSSIEPDIWKKNGGDKASISYFNGMLVIKAPQYVHQKIGLPVAKRQRRYSSTSSNTGNSRTTSRNAGAPDAGKNSSYVKTQTSTPGNVAGVSQTVRDIP